MLRAARRARRARGVLLVLSMLIGLSGVVPTSGPGGVLAGPDRPRQQEAVTPDSDVPTEPPATDVPPTEVPPTEIPPTEPPPTEVPPTEVPPTDEPTVPPTETPVPTETATAEPTSTVTATPSVTPTATPSPAVAWSLGAGPSCTTDEDAVESGGSVVYTCTLAGTVVASAAPDLALDLAWGITTDESSGDWTIAVRPSAQDAWADAGTGTPLSIVDAFVTGSDTSAQTLARTLSFQLRLTRAACVTDDPPVHILVTADLTAPDAPAVPVSAQGTTTANAVVTPVLAAIPEPSIAFLGPLAFGQVSLPSTDQVVVLGGSTTLQVDGLDRSCGVWTIAIESGSLATADGRDLDAANLLLVSVNGQLAPTSPCGLDEPCLVAVIVAGPTSVPSIQLSLGFQVIVPADAPLGVLNAPVTATIFQETASP